MAGQTRSTDYPTTPGAWDWRPNLSRKVFVSRLRMGVRFHADRYALPLKRAGSQNLSLHAGRAHAASFYAIAGTLSGTRPGITINQVQLPINFDAYTNYTILAAPPPIWVRFKGVLDGKGEATASFNVPAGLPALPGITLYHAYLVFDSRLNVQMASNPVPLRLY